jgi:hypothetical protein
MYLWLQFCASGNTPHPLPAISSLRLVAHLLLVHFSLTHVHISYMRDLVIFVIFIFLYFDSPSSSFTVLVPPSTTRCGTSCSPLSLLNPSLGAALARLLLFPFRTCCTCAAAFLCIHRAQSSPRNTLVSIILFHFCHQRYLEQVVSCVWDENGHRKPPTAPLSSEQKAADESEALFLLQQLCNRHLHSFIPKKACVGEAQCPIMP